MMTQEKEITIADELDARDALYRLAEPHFHSRGGGCITQRCVDADTSTSTFYRFCNGRGGLGIKIFINLAREFGYDVVLRKREVE